LTGIDDELRQLQAELAPVGRPVQGGSGERDRARAADGIVTATTEIGVKAGNTVTVKVTGPAVVRVTRPGASAGADQTATLPGLAEAIALVTARHHGIPSPGLSGEVPPAAVAAALVVLAGTFLAHLLPVDSGARFLQDLGAVAAGADGTTEGKEPPA
jgi:hypothetical protein